MKNKILLLLGALMFLPNISFSQSDKYSEGNIQMRDKNYKRAEYYYKLALEQEPENVAIMQALVSSLFAQKKFVEADSLLREAVELDTNNHTTYWQLAKCNNYMKEDSIAVYWYEKFIDCVENKSISTTSAHWEIILSYDRILRKQGLSEEQYYNLQHHANRFMILYPDAPEIAPIKKLLGKLNANEPDFSVKGTRIFLEKSAD